MGRGRVHQLHLHALLGRAPGYAQADESTADDENFHRGSFRIGGSFLARDCHAWKMLGVTFRPGEETGWSLSIRLEHRQGRK